MTTAEFLIKALAASVVVCLLLLTECSRSQLTFTPGWRTRILVKERSARSGGLALSPMSKRQNGEGFGSKLNDEMVLSGHILSAAEHDPWMTHSGTMHVPDRAADAWDNGENELARACALLRDHLTRMLLLPPKKDVVVAQLHALWEQVCADRIRAASTK
ncbi:uncharacterized protein LOC129601287 [Paramacrobiotus metropolitanus]|uniref:uncharacterized protein LOC129601287 n=1 Tax=Paramacrobiotus metropolitanus TaxID=2943436 RepID=UPI0024463868|nr:uncharacterized protein LOC129601287 [Paramacrobiotus metropolitanus]